jgi:two-component system OmpR family response regulator
MPQLLVASPDEVVRQAFRRSLTPEGHTTFDVQTLSQARRALASLDVDLLCLDTAFRRSELVAFWGWLRSDPDCCNLPALLLASRRAVLADGLLPLAPDAARDQVLAKPLEQEELRREVARLLGVARRAARGERPLRAGPLRLRLGQRELSFAGGASVRLTPTEFRLIRYLMERVGEVVSTEELLEQVWGYAAGTAGPELVRAHIRNLRAKIRAAGLSPELSPELIRTLPRHGYGLLVR